MRFAPGGVGSVKLAAIAAVMVAGSYSYSAVTKHFSFKPRESVFGGGASVVAPVPKEISDAYDRGVKEQQKDLSVIGKVTEVVDAGTVVVTPNGGRKHTVKLAKISAPKSTEPCAEQAKCALKKLLDGKKVTVKYRTKDQFGNVIGVVWYGKVNVNLSLVRSGYAKSTDKEYDDAQRLARQAKLGVWAEAK